MAAWRYEFYLLVLKVSLTSERSERMRDRKVGFPCTPMMYFFNLHFRNPQDALNRNFNVPIP